MACWFSLLTRRSRGPETLFFYPVHELAVYRPIEKKLIQAYPCEKAKKSVRNWCPHDIFCVRPVNQHLLAEANNSYLIISARRQSKRRGHPRHHVEPPSLLLLPPPPLGTLHCPPSAPLVACMKYLGFTSDNSVCALSISFATAVTKYAVRDRRWRSGKLLIARPGSCLRHRSANTKASRRGLVPDRQKNGS